MANSLLAVKWERFFVDVGIPNKIAAEYAKRFVEQRVQFEMRGELTKSILVELGIKALGDQMAIMHFLKKESEKGLDGTDANDSASVASNISIKNEKSLKVPKKTLKAPDRDDIYHIRMPSGSTPKTREILKKQDLLRSAGLMKRGLNGIRKSGEEIRLVNKPVVSRLAGTSSAEVSSTTQEVYELLGLRGLVSDSLPQPKVFANQIGSKADVRLQRRKQVGDPAALFKRTLNEATAVENQEPVFRVRIPFNGESSSSGRYSQTVSVNPSISMSRGRPIKFVSGLAGGRIQKRLSVQSRLSVAPSRVASRKRRFNNSISVFDRLG